MSPRDQTPTQLHSEEPDKDRLVPLFEMVPRTTSAGVPILNEDGTPQMKRRTETTHIPGHNLRLAFDKSVSEALIAYADDPKGQEIIRQAAFDAVDSVMSNLVENHLPLVDGGKGKPLVPAEQMMWFTTLGMSARPTPESRSRGYVADPHFVADVFIPNMVMAGGKMRTMEGRSLFLNAKTLGKAVEVEFNRLLESQGISIERTKFNLKGEQICRIAGSSTDVRRLFSTNHELTLQIREGFERAKDREPTRKELDAIQQSRRGRKTTDAKIADRVGNQEQLQRWSQAVIDAGLTLGIEKRGEAADPLPADTRKAALFYRLESALGVTCGNNDAVFGPDVVLPAVYRLADGVGFDTAELKDIADEYLKNELVLMPKDNKHPRPRYTTQTVLANEREIAARLDAKAAERVRAISPEQLRFILRSGRFKLDREQYQLVQAAVSSRKLVHGIGRAGAGKSYSAQAIVYAMRQAKTIDQVVVAAVARKRAEELAADVKADRKGSVESIKRQVGDGKITMTKDTLVILDEAALANTYDMTDLLRAIGPAKLVTLGDHRQALSIGPGGWYEKTLAKHGSVELKTVRRHTNKADLSAFELIREGKGKQALKNLDDRQRVFVAAQEWRMRQQVRDGYVHWRSEGYGDDEINILHQGDNRRLDAMNRMIQRVRLHKGELVDSEKIALNETSSGRNWTIYRGDRIITTKGVKSGMSRPIFNGTTGTVLHVYDDGRVRLKLDDSERRVVTVQLTPEAEVQPIVPAYCVSTAKFQGSSIKVDLVMPGNPAITTANSLYSQTTRTVDVCEVYVDNETWGEKAVEHLGKVASQHDTRVEASYYLEMLNKPSDQQQTIAPDVAERLKERGIDLTSGTNMELGV